MESGTVDVEYDAERQMIKSRENQQINFTSQMLNFNANHFVPQQQMIGGFTGKYWIMIYLFISNLYI